MYNYKFLSATGKIPYNMTNDYMFRMVLQKDRETLINLTCSLLHLSSYDIKDITILNPINPGETMDEKEFQLDILVSLNDNTFINYEMQVLNYNNWPMRSLAYLCREFERVSRGSDYNTIKPVYHIGFLDFTLFEDHPEFFARYQMKNVKDGYIYTDKFNLYVLELNHSDMATDEDKAYGIDTWAKLFKSTTWEEIKMITKDNPSMNSAAESIFLSNSDWIIQEQCRRREDQIAHEAYQKEQLQKLTEKLSSLTNENISLANENVSLTNENTSLTNEIAHLKKLLEENGISCHNNLP